MANVKPIPYGISNFVQLRRENKYYDDKTMYIARLEDAGNFLFLVRPRHFGKSIFLSMMRAYYDINERDSFDELFGDLYVHRHPTPLHGQFQVLFLDLSQVGGDSDTVRERFEQYGGRVMDDFIKRYRRFYDEEVEEAVAHGANFADKLTTVCLEARNRGYQLYLIIDEYDNFTNNILNQEGETVYHDLTHASGFYRDVFKLFKPNFTRILMMGVTTVTTSQAGSTSH